MIYIVLGYVVPVLIGLVMVVSSIFNKRCSEFFEINCHGDALLVTCMLLLPLFNIYFILLFIQEKLNEINFWKRRLHD